MNEYIEGRQYQHPDIAEHVGPCRHLLADVPVAQEIDQTGDGRKHTDNEAHDQEPG